MFRVKSLTVLKTAVKVRKLESQVDTCNMVLHKVRRAICSSYMFCFPPIAFFPALLSEWFIPGFLCHCFPKYCKLLITTFSAFEVVPISLLNFIASVKAFEDYEFYKLSSLGTSLLCLLLADFQVPRCLADNIIHLTIVWSLIRLCWYKQKKEQPTQNWKSKKTFTGQIPQFI